MKKITAAVAAFSLLISSAVSVVGEETVILADENFNNGAIISHVAECIGDVQIAAVPENAANDKSLRLYTAAQENAEIMLKLSENTAAAIIEMNIRCEGDRLERIVSVSDEAGAKYDVMSVRKGGKLIMAGGSETTIKDYKTGQWYHAALLLNLNESTMSVYIDGAFAAKVEISKEAPKSFDTVTVSQIGVNGAADITFIDDVRVYQANEPNKKYNIKKSKYFSTVVVPKPEEGLSAGSTTSYDSVNLLLFSDFEGDTDSELGPKTWTSVKNNGAIGAYRADKRHGYSVKLAASSKSGNPILAKDLFDYALKADNIGDFVIDFDSLYSDNAHMSMFSIKDENNETIHDIFRTTVGGGWGLVSDSAKYTGSYSGAKWYSIQLVFHSDGTSYQTYDLYINNEKLADGMPIIGNDFSQVKSVRLSHTGTEGAESFWAIDNFKIYQGSEPVKNLDVSSFISETVGEDEKKEETPFDDKNEIRELLSPFIVIGEDCKNAIVNGELKSLDEGNADIKTIVKEGKTYVPVRFLSERLGAEVKWNGEARQAVVKYDGGEAVFTADSHIVNVNGENQETDAAAFVFSGRVYVPLRVITRLMNKQIKWFSNGIVAIGERYERFSAFDKTLKRSSLLECAYRQLYYPSPDKETVLNDFKTNKSVHPSVVLTSEAIERMKSGIKTDKNMARFYMNIKEQADKLLDMPPNVYSLSGAGGVLLQISRSTKARVEYLSLAYYLTGEAKYKDRLWQELEAVCAFPDWNTKNYLSLAEMTYAVTIGYDWLYNDWSGEQRAILEKSIYEKALLTAVKAYTSDSTDNWWAYASSNWNSVSNGNMAIAALALKDVYPEESALIFEKAFEGLGYLLTKYSNGGGFGEGPGYWAYATKYMVYLMASCENSINTDYGLFEAPGIDQTGYFLPYMSGSRNSFNFHDATETVEAAPEILYLGKRMNNTQMQSVRMNMIETGLSESNVYDLIWYDPAIKKESGLPLDRKFENISTASFRSAWEDTNCTYAAIHAGFVRDAHAQLDMGDFVFDAIGERWAVELAMEDYSYEGYFGDFRWTFYRARAEGQNTIVINPSQEPDQQCIDAKGTIERFESKEKGGYTIIDLTTGYPDAKSARRGIMLTDDRSTVIVQDEFTMKDESDVYWFMHTKADIDISDDGKTAILTQNGKTMYAHIISDEPLHFGVMNAEPMEMTPHVEQSKNVGVRKLVINADYVKQFNAAVVFSPNEDALKRSYTALDNWNIPDGKIQKPHAKGIYVDGELIEGFQPFRAKYTVTVPSDFKELPDITVDSDWQAEINKSDSVLDNTLIRVFDPNDPKKAAEYEISYNTETIFGRPDGMKKLDIKEASASYSPQAESGYTPDKTIDGDLSTRWSAEAVNYLQYDLGENVCVAAVGIAWMNGSKRQAYYSIEVSDDAENWEKVYNGTSSGLTDNFETCTFKEVSCRYVRLTGYGNSQNKWISPNEVEIYSR